MGEHTIIPYEYLLTNLVIIINLSELPAIKRCIFSTTMILSSSITVPNDRVMLTIKYKTELHYC